MLLPGKTSTSITPVRSLSSGQKGGLLLGSVRADTTIVDGTSNLGSNITSAYKTAKRLPMGLVLVEDASGDVYVEANDPGRKNATAPSITSAEDVDAGWDDSTLSFYLDDSLVTSETGAGSGGSDTVAEWVTALNSNAVFAAHFVAVAVSSTLKVTARRGGEHVSMRIECDDNVDAYAQATATGSEESAVGTSPRYCVVDKDTAVLEDENGTATDAQVPVVFAGEFDASNLISLTGEARAALKRQGSRFI